jgi:MFS family permease
VAFFLLGGVCGSALEVVLTSLSSVFVPPRAQGRLFAGLLLVKLGGSVVGNLVGTALFQTSMDATSGPWLLRGGALPIEVFALPALINLAGLVCVLPQQLDGFPVVGVGDLCEMEQRVFPEVGDDFFPHRQ